MKLDILIRNGHVIDTARGIDGIREIGIAGGRIVEVEGTPEATQVVNAEGCYVFPGLIDFHTHLYHKATVFGVYPEYLPASGVTAAVDPGSSGCGNFVDFYDKFIARSCLHIKALLSCSPLGMALTPQGNEDFNPALFDKEKIKALREHYPDVIFGLKIRISKFLVDNLEHFYAAVKMAEEIGNMPLCVHITDPAGDIRDVINKLRKGDIVCHMYNGLGSIILDDSGNLLKEIQDARKRGVIFDVANGRMHSCHKVALAAIEQGFYPDIISTDVTEVKYCYGDNARSLPYVMSKFLNMGLDLQTIARCVTETPAKVMQMEGQIGTLAPGAFADVSILKLIDRKTVFLDEGNEAFYGDRLFIPQMTILNGEIAFGQIDFNLAN